jgi:tRNA 2-thiouridine synthesizing protein B
MILHIVSRSPFTHDALERCRAALAHGDAILLIEDGVLALATPDRFLAGLQSHPVHVLLVDVQARGLTLPGNVQSVDYSGFVDLVAHCSKSVSWF